MQKKCRIAIVGATGLVGSTLLSLLHARVFDPSNLHVLASEQSLGKTLAYGEHALPLEALSSFDFSKIDIAFFCVSNELAKEYIPKATQAGAIVIDKSSYYRNHPDVPLVVPEVNPLHLASRHHTNIIASPNCNTIPIAVALQPLMAAAGIDRINIATYQSVSGTGKDAVLELREQTERVLSNETLNPRVYAQPIAFNVLPYIDAFEENGYTREEMKMVNELRKIFDQPLLAINPTAVRVPVLCGHGAAVHIETSESLSLKAAQELLERAPGIVYANAPCATPLTHAANQDAVYVSRLRKDISHERGLNFWVVADNLRKGAALNALQIAELIWDGVK